MDLDLIAAGIRSFGSFLGAILALVFQPPKTLPEFATRSVFSLISGAVFGEPVREWLKWSDRPTMVIAAAAITALASWWAWGTAVRVIGAWKPK